MQKKLNMLYIKNIIYIEGCVDDITATGTKSELTCQVQIAAKDVITLH